MEIIHHNGMCLSCPEATLYVFGRPIKLTRKKLGILELFFTRPRIIITRHMMMEKVWKINSYDYCQERAIDIHISAIRNMIFPNNTDLAHKIIESVYGRGYILNDFRK